MSLNAIGLAFGVSFGFLLGWARVTDYDVIRNMLLLREADVFLLMMSAILTAAVGVRVLRWFGVNTVVDRNPIAWRLESPQRRHVIGSVLFGFGWSIANTCPGPVAAQLGRGQFVALFTITGLFVGIAVRDRLHARRQQMLRDLAISETATAVGL